MPAPEAAEPLSGATDRAAWPTPTSADLASLPGLPRPVPAQPLAIATLPVEVWALTRVQHDALRRAGRPVVLGGTAGWQRGLSNCT